MPQRKLIPSSEYQGSAPAKVQGGAFGSKPSAEAWSEGGDWAVVSSSNVKAIRYDLEARDLYVQFLDGSVYRYKQVAPDKARRMYEAKSMGKFVWAELRELHGYEKVR